MTALTVCCPQCDARIVLDRAGRVVAACDVLVLRALELVGKRIVRADRSRWRRMGDHPMTVAHLLWQADAATLDRALAGCWDGMLDRVLDEHHPDADVAAVAAVLDRYVRDLVVEQVGHRLDELRVRLGPVLP